MNIHSFSNPTETQSENLLDVLTKFEKTFKDVIGESIEDFVSCLRYQVYTEDAVRIIGKLISLSTGYQLLGNGASRVAFLDKNTNLVIKLDITEIEDGGSQVENESLAISDLISKGHTKYLPNIYRSRGYTCVTEYVPHPLDYIYPNKQDRIRIYHNLQEYFKSLGYEDEVLDLSNKENIRVRSNGEIVVVDLGYLVLQQDPTGDSNN